MKKIINHISKGSSVFQPECSEDCCNIRAQRTERVIKFEKWLNEYGIGEGKHRDLTLDEQFDVVKSKVAELKGSEIDIFTFNCGAIASVAYLHPDVLKEFVDALEYVPEQQG